ncbi:hypothetical protein O5O45_13145 [Hahella aquimaris]|uniref:arsenate reductase/protein-tyrosine-phosphatase family protein n=1 Tax=Hahella sp. HNIBRBA332 TaxID=3015983 RepID=UPI00273A8896|nr:hypothetical protein [Hahella sp. HNIBRBA332]WLQ16861.1 hypothetical protein O5O45_13145 [Hahella sp. HNIBRBA332]
MGKLKKLLKLLSEYLFMVLGFYKRYSDIPPGFSPQRVIFVCKGNVCRSVYAEAFLKGRLQKDKVEIVSCGLATDGGTLANPTAKEVAAERGVGLSDHRSTRIQDMSMRQGDLFIVMEPYMVHALDKYRKDDAESHVLILGMVGPDQQPTIPDPYGREVSVFNKVFDTIESKLSVLQKSL